MKKIYVASSWRNKHQEFIVSFLREQGYDVYDFKNPNGEEGFSWSKISHFWQSWTMREFRDSLKNKYALYGFNRDFSAMKDADICVLCLPCGRSAHLEAGWMKGNGKKVIAYINPNDVMEPELMYNLLDNVALDIIDLVEQIESL